MILLCYTLHGKLLLTGLHHIYRPECCFEPATQSVIMNIYHFSSSDQSKPEGHLSDISHFHGNGQRYISDISGYHCNGICIPSSWQLTNYFNYALMLTSILSTLDSILDNVLDHILSTIYHCRNVFLM